MESFEDRVETLFKELEFAFQWQRPSILLASYEKEDTRRKVNFSLEQRLLAINHPLKQIRVNENRYDIPLILSRRSDRQEVVYSIPHLSRGGGTEGANAYRALNIRRELLVDYHIRVLFWLTRKESISLSRHAPDFWAFRHLVVEYDNPAQEYQR